MAVRQDAEQSKTTGLEKLSSVELIEMLVNKIITYRGGLVAYGEGSVYHSAEQLNKHRKEEYMEMTKPLREELAKRLEPRNPEVY